jgi:hypothetical protein
MSRQLIPHWDTPDLIIWRCGEARNLIRAAGLPASAALPIIREASDKAGVDTERFFEIVEQRIDEFKTPSPLSREGE